MILYTIISCVYLFVVRCVLFVLYCIVCFVTTSAWGMTDAPTQLVTDFISRHNQPSIIHLLGTASVPYVMTKSHPPFQRTKLLNNSLQLQLLTPSSPPHYITIQYIQYVQYNTYNTTHTIQYIQYNTYTFVKCSH
jgi:hypothetical protein